MFNFCMMHSGIVNIFIFIYDMRLQKIAKHCNSGYFSMKFNYSNNIIHLPFQPQNKRYQQNIMLTVNLQKWKKLFQPPVA